MCAAYGIKFRSVDIDAMEYQENNRGGKIRTALRNKTTWDTFPQIFIGGKFVGGCTDVFDDCKDGKLQKMLKELNIDFNKKANKDPSSFLPGWLHPR
ncbi:MAG: glutaredoxin [Kordiimonadaceae bacterium]|jgi:cysteine synthase|nr:glutaredoxin [Kordiimonadaceae bacterium]MBT6033411.1 glutaredoxin [Kordiimonadaceae bacterium]